MTREDRWLQPEEALTDTLRCYVCDEPLEYDDDWPPAPIRCTCEDEPEEETEDEEAEAEAEAGI